MLYPDFKLRYSCLGQDAIKSSEDNKTAVYALMDGIPFDRERYRLGHTLVFFRAGSLGGLEEERDKLVIKWVRFIQGEVLKRVRGFVYQKKFDQRELIKVGQRNFRKYLASRDWGWFVLIQKTRGLIGQPNPEEELRILEEKANATWGKYQEALQVTANLSGSMDSLKDEIKAMGKQLAEEQGNISVYTDRQAKATATKATAESELKDAQAVLSSEESSRVELSAEVKAHSGSVGVVKKEIEDIELAISKVELEKGNRDHTIKVLQDEIAEQDEVINKLNKEKKHIAETQAKSNDDMITVNEKAGHLNSVKSKLESTLDELEGGLDKEKKGRAALEKTKRKVEGDLKMSQDGVAELERAERDLEVVIGNKDKNNAQLAAKLDDEQNLVAKAQKGIKEIQGRVEAMEEELEAERQARAKAERQRSDLAREIDSLGERLDEASGATTAQVELNKKRDAEVNKLRKDGEEANIQQESILGNLKRKQGDAIAEMSEQIDALGKMKSKIEKDKGQIMNEIADARAATDEVMRAQASSDKSNKTMLEGLNAINKKVDNANLTLGDFVASKNKIAVENSDLLRIVGDLDNNLNILAKQRSALAAQLNDVKALCDNEARERGLLLGKYRNLEHELGGAREALDEEAAGRENTLRLCAKAEAESQCWRQKYETDAVAKGEELEMTRMKLTARLTEAEAAIDNLNAKLTQVEKAKAKIAGESSDMANSLDQAQVLNAAMDRKAKQFDKVIGEWKGKVDRLSFDLDVSQKETRNASSELFKVKSAYEETMLQLEEALRVSFWLTSRSNDRRSTLPFHSPMTLSNCLAFLSMAALRTWAWSRLLAMSLLSEAILPLAFSTWVNFAFRLSMAASASVRRAVSFILVISSSSPLATASVSYFWRQHWDSASAFAQSLKVFSRPAASSSRASRAPSSSCSRFPYLPRSRPLSRASLSHRALTSLSWAARAAFCLARMFRLLSRSPTMRRRSEFSTAILFLEAAKSPRVRLALSTFLLMALRVSSIFLLDISAEA